jgi:hypothetical protein
MPDTAIRREAAKFRNYWHAIPGQRGVKLDWNATWRNWCIRSTEDRLKDQNRQRSAGGSIFEIHQRIYGQREPHDE